MLAVWEHLRVEYIKKRSVFVHTSVCDASRPFHRAVKHLPLMLMRP